MEGCAPGDGQDSPLAERHAAVGAQDALVPAYVSSSVYCCDLVHEDGSLTLDDLASADSDVEVAAADGGVESMPELAMDRGFLEGLLVETHCLPRLSF